MKSLTAIFVAASVLALSTSASAHPMHHHRHKVCTIHHHHRVCVWR